MSGILNSPPSRERWIEEVKLLSAKRTKATWDLADALVYGREQAFDPDFAEASQITGYSRSWCWTLHAVALAFPTGRRNAGLSFSAHRELLREKDPTDRLLLMSRALEEGWTQYDVAAHFTRNPPATKPASVTYLKTLATPSGYKHAEVKCPSCGHHFPVKGHKVNALAPEVPEGERQAPRGGDAEP